jgi:ubiquinone/menaquinone biosynthesis C-methylase UbiE
MNHEHLATLLKCPECGTGVRYRPRVYSYSCSGQVLHTFRVREEVADMVGDDSDGRQRRVDRIFSRVAGRRYERFATGAGLLDRTFSKVLWGTTKFIPLQFELLSSVTADCEPGFFLDAPVGTAVFTAGEYSLQPNLEFIAVDYNRDMLSAALEKIQAEDFGNVMLVRADIARLPFVDGTFSGAMTMNGIGSFPDSRGALDEFARVIKPGGKFAGSIYIRGERRITDFLISWLFGPLGMFSAPFFTAGEFEYELEKRGMQNVITRKVGPIMFFSCRKRKRASDAHSAD